MANKLAKAWLVVSASGELRLRKSRPWADQLGLDEVAFALVVTYPDSWGREVGTINLEVPEGAIDIQSAEWFKAQARETEGVGNA